jgi:hypothetical protein
MFLIVKQLSVSLPPFRPLILCLQLNCGRDSCVGSFEKLRGTLDIRVHFILKGQFQWPFLEEM